MSFADAEAWVRRLAASHPDLLRIRITAIGLRARQGDHLGALAEARALLVEHFDDASVQETVAALSCCDGGSTESWLHYKLALQAGGLSSPEMRRAALLAGRRSGEGDLAAHLVLRRVGLVERLVLRTRMVPVDVLLKVVAAVWFAGVGLGLARFYPGSLTLLGIDTLILGWFAFAIVYTCWQRRAILVIMMLIPTGWALFGAVIGLKTAGWPWLLVGAVLALIPWGRLRSRGPKEQPSGDSARV